jgi:hypothetical protein
MILTKEDGWLKIEGTERTPEDGECFVLSFNADIQLPAVVSTSSIRGVFGRLKTASNEVLTEWTFEEDDQTKPIYFESPRKVDTTFWVEMRNLFDKEAIVHALVHCVKGQRDLEEKCE